MDAVTTNLYREWAENNEVLSYKVDDISINTMMYWSEDILENLTLRRHDGRHLVLFDLSKPDVTMSYLVLTSRDLFNIGITTVGRRRLEEYFRAYPQNRVYLAVVLSKDMAGQIAKNHNRNALSDQVIGKVFFEEDRAVSWLLNQQRASTPTGTKRLNIADIGMNQREKSFAELVGERKEYFIMINGAVECLNFSHKDQLVIGRKSNDSAKIDVDLTTYGKMAEGISRQHARLHVENDQLYITDLNSTNGTFVDNKRVKPFTAVRIDKNSSLRLGKLTFNILR